MARGAVALERLYEDARGDLVYTCTKPWSDGTTGITLSPVALLEKLAALVPLPRVHLVRLWRVSGAAQSAAWGDHPDAAPTGCGWASYHDSVVSLELGAAAAASVCPGSDALPVLSAWRAPDRCRHHPRGGAHADPPASDPGVRPTSQCPCPFSPRDVRLGGLSSRHRMWPRGRRACDGGVSRERATPLSFEIPSPPAFPEPRHPWRSPPLPPLAARVQPQGGYAVPLYALRWGARAGLPRGAGGAGGAGGEAGALGGSRGRTPKRQRKMPFGIPSCCG